MSNVPDALAFSNNFWGKESNGVTNLLGRMRDSKLCMEEIGVFLKERVSIEEDYARRMLALSRKGLGSSEMGTLRQALDVIRTNSETMGKSHAASAQQIKTQLSNPLETFASSIRQRRKTTQSTVEKLNKAKQTQNLNVEKARAKFEGDCNKINGYYAQQNLLMGKELEKNNMKLDKVHQSIDHTKREYQHSLRLLAETIDQWNKDWKQACDKFQDLEEERINFLKSNLWAYTNIVSTVCVSDDEGCENIRVALEKCDLTKDIETFVREKGTGKEIQDPPEFVNFMQGYSRESTQTGHKFANFSRTDEDEGGVVDPKQEFDGTVPLQRSMSMSSVESAKSQVAVAQTAPIVTKQMPVAAPMVMSNETISHSQILPPVTQAPLISHPKDRANSVPQLKFEDEEDYNSIPVLSHPADSSTAQSSPVQASPNSSVYSNTTSISSVSETELNDEPKRRTWASPFRRRSKKDLSKGWNSPSQQSTITAKSFAKESTSSDKKSSTPGSVLSMGENMFDLGVTHQGSKSPFDSRSRSVSPTKSFSRDDPLVMALEKLKGTDNSSRYGSIGGGAIVGGQSGKRVSSKSAPTSPIKQNGGNFFPSKPKSALVPPQPAFTATDMENTSSKYHSQTQEMFQPKSQAPQQEQQPPMQRPRSQMDMREPQQSSRPLRQRPKSFYHDYEDDHQQPYQQHSRSKSAVGFNNDFDYGYHQAPPSAQDPYRRSVSPGPPPPQQQQNSYRRSVSPAPPQDPYRRSVSPAPPQDPYRRSVSPAPPQDPYRRSVSPAPQQDPYRRSVSPAPPQDTYRRSVSPAPYQEQQQPLRQSRAASPNPYQQSQSRGASPAPSARQSYYEYDDSSQPPMRPRSKSSVDVSGRPKPRRRGTLPSVASDGRKVLRYSKAAYDYRQAIPEEVSFRKGDVLLVVACQADGWWEVEVLGSRGRFGLAPSNFLAEMSV